MASATALFLDWHLPRGLASALVLAWAVIQGCKGSPGLAIRGFEPGAPAAAVF